MIGLLLFLQTAAAAQAALVVRDAAGQVSIPVIVAAGEPMVRADAVMSAMKSALVNVGPHRFALVLPRARLELMDGAPFARADLVMIPLSRAPQMRGGILYLPLQFVSEIIPRYAGGYFYDRASRELRTFNSVAKRTPGPTIPAATAQPQRQQPPRQQAPAPRARRVVVIDPGHGGRDPGMTGPIGGSPWFVEKEVVLAVSKKLGAALRRRGLDVVLTRTTDTLIALADRGPIANRNHGDVFISIHVNAPGSRNAAGARERGFETYFLAEAKTADALRVQEMENEAVKFETGADAPKGDPLSFIITDMAQNEHLRESSDLAQTIQMGLIDVHPGPNRGVNQANFAVLRGSYMPAVLIELGFGTNRSEATFLSDDRNQTQLANKIAESIVAYLARYETRVGGAR
ncbi:MAG TPA: N-acetylmuramoyl-L-alanine amidase [Gemmatimonadaceae bacterium]|nr:N-acetylmuramoyl-L-alanine amidase [Gemmatimonadaceae bacterium]